MYLPEICIIVLVQTFQKTGGTPYALYSTTKPFQHSRTIRYGTTEKYDAIISAIDIRMIYREVMKKSNYGAPEELNYASMIISISIRYLDRIPTIKNYYTKILLSNLITDFQFRMPSRRKFLIHACSRISTIRCLGESSKKAQLVVIAFLIGIPCKVFRLSAKPFRNIFCTKSGTFIYILGTKSRSIIGVI